jgi:hypothetical protein
MKRFTLLFLIGIIMLCIGCGGSSGGSGSSSSSNEVSVRGYHRSNGTYVSPHYRTKPNNTYRDNYSTYPNINPHTHKMGSR